MPEADVASRTITIDGGRVRVLESGDRGRPAVVMVHGVGAWAEQWRELMQRVTAGGRYAVAFDVPGAGESTAPSGVRHFDGPEPFHATLVWRVLDALDIRRAHVVGQSLGGAIAYMAAVTEPSRTMSLTMIAPGGLGADLPFIFRVAALPGAALLARSPLPRSFGRAAVRSCFSDPSRCPDWLIEQADRYVRPGLPEAVRVLRGGVGLRGVRRDVRDAWVRRATAYAGPAIVVWGRDDTVLPIAHAAYAKDVVPQAELHVIEDCGHLVMLEQPERCAEIVLSFLARAEAGTLVNSA